jgi:hypothetical protein
MLQKDTLYVKIGSTMCIRTTLQKHNAGSYSLDHTIQVCMHPFVLIAYICGFRKDRLLMDYLKNVWINDHNNDVTMG